MSTRPFLATALIGLIAGLAACAPAASPPRSIPPSVPPTTPSASPSAGIGSAPAAWLAVGRRGEPGIRVLLASTAETMVDLPDGTPRANWRGIVATTHDATSTIVRDLMVQPGLPGPELRVPGRWRLPTIGSDAVSAGTSADGSTIVLIEDPPTDVSSSRFAVVQHGFLDQVTTAADAELRLTRIVALPRAVEFDALSPDGRILYVVEHLESDAGGRYQVRAVDVATGVMRDTIIADKRNLEEAMAGWPITQLRRDDDFVLTLYRGREHPFIHALNTREAWAVCIDLPADGKDDAAAALDWGLAAAPDGRAIYAVNGTLGLAVDVDPGELIVRRTAALATAAAAPFVLAKFGHSDIGPVGRRLIVAPDGRKLYAAGSGGVLAIGSGDLSVIRHDLADSAIEAIGLTPDGATLFALDRDGRIHVLDTASGRVLGTVPGGTYDRLLAVAPW